MVSVPGILEAPITIECKVIYQQTESKEKLADDVIERFYKDEDDPECALHTMFVGEIVNTYIAKGE